MSRDTADVGRNGHPVVVEDHDQRFIALSGIVEALVGKAAGQCAVAHEGNHVIVLLLQRPGPGHTQGRGHRRRGVSRHEGVAGTFRWLGESGKSAKGPQRRKALPATRQNFMHIGLMPHVKDQPIFGGVKNTLQRDRQLHHTQIGCQMTSGLSHMEHQELPQLVAEQPKLLLVQGAQFLSGIDLI